MHIVVLEITKILNIDDNTITLEVSENQLLSTIGELSRLLRKEFNKERCAKGHELTLETIYISRGRTHCKECVRLRDKKRIEKRKALRLQGAAHAN